MKEIFWTGCHHCSSSATYPGISQGLLETGQTRNLSNPENAEAGEVVSRPILLATFITVQPGSRSPFEKVNT